jgi:hypothetical protein
MGIGTPVIQISPLLVPSVTATMLEFKKKQRRVIADSNKVTPSTSRKPTRRLLLPWTLGIAIRAERNDLERRYRSCTVMLWRAALAFTLTWKYKRKATPGFITLQFGIGIWDIGIYISSHSL